MAQGKVLLLEVLKGLEAKDMKTLMWYLRESVLDGYPPLSKSQLEGADREDMVDLLVETYSMEGARLVTADILKQMKQKELLKKLTAPPPAAPPPPPPPPTASSARLRRTSASRAAPAAAAPSTARSSATVTTGGPPRRPPPPPCRTTRGLWPSSAGAAPPPPPPPPPASSARSPPSSYAGWGQLTQRAVQAPQCPPMAPGLILLTPKPPGTREYLLQYARPLSLDPNTVEYRLSLSEENRKVTRTDEDQGYAPHPERFIRYPQVLCREGQSARCYWEVEWSGNYVDTAVCYRDMRRDAVGPADVPASGFGLNNKSWSLVSYSYRGGGYSFYHNNVDTTVSGPWSSRIGVYLDHKAGTLSFYSVSDNMTVTLLHTVQTTFTQDLYPGICVNYVGDTAELMKIW